MAYDGGSLSNARLLGGGSVRGRSTTLHLSTRPFLDAAFLLEVSGAEAASEAEAEAGGCNEQAITLFLLFAMADSDDGMSMYRSSLEDHFAVRAVGSHGPTTSRFWW